jgi:hypothetical protein
MSMFPGAIKSGLVKPGTIVIADALRRFGFTGLSAKDCKNAFSWSAMLLLHRRHTLGPPPMIQIVNVFPWPYLESACLHQPLTVPVAFHQHGPLCNVRVPVLLEGLIPRWVAVALRAHRNRFAALWQANCIPTCFFLTNAAFCHS